MQDCNCLRVFSNISKCIVISIFDMYLFIQLVIHYKYIIIYKNIIKDHKYVIYIIRYVLKLFIL